MKLEDLQQDSIAMSRWERHRFFVLIFGVIIISMLLVSVALGLYNSSGTAQLDLSRPGYQDVRRQATREGSAVSYPANGDLDQKALDLFRDLYKARAQKAAAGDSFSSNALSDESLQLFDTQEPKVTAQ